MMMAFWRLILICFAFSGSLSAAHLVGGELSYTCLGNNRYEVKLLIYRDCSSNGAPFDDPAIITIYDDNLNIVANLEVPLHTSGRLPVDAPNTCYSLPSFVCTEEGLYLDTVFLPPTPGGYTLSHQRCCRNQSINNIPNPGDWGNTYTIEIPANDNSCNSSPRFTTTPPVALCLNINNTINTSAFDPDGDSLVYSLCFPLHGGGTQATTRGPNSPRPDTATPPPYQVVPFLFGYSAGSPLPGGSFLDPQTGILTTTPTLLGQYVIGICVEEWRNGVMIGVLRRDFQFNITNACAPTEAKIKPQNQDPYELCAGKTIQFEEDCFNTTTYFWDFGVANTNADTSRLANPTFTFPDTGTYTVTLIANPNSVCADTTTLEFKVLNPINAGIDIQGQACFDQHFFNFNSLGSFSGDALFTWNFGGATNQGNSSNQRNPSGVVYTIPGTYYISLEIQDGPCRDIVYDTVQLFPRPVLRHRAPSGRQCAPVLAQFSDSSSYSGQALHFWDFGDGNTSTQASPQHTYTQAGTYFVRHQIITTEGCKDTLDETFDNPIVVLPSPQADFNVSPSRTTIFEPEFSLRIGGSGYNRQFTLLPDGRRIQGVTEFVYIAQDTGVQRFLNVSENEFGCTDSVWIETYVEDPFSFFIPSAFTPNGDGLNDVLEFQILGVRSLEFSIFNRWGERVHVQGLAGPFWDGNNPHTGERHSQGNYTYLLEAVGKEGEAVQKRGNVRLIR